MKGQNYLFKIIGWVLSSIAVLPVATLVLGFIGCRLIMFAFLLLQFVWNKTVVYSFTKDELVKLYIKEMTFSKEAGYILKGMVRQINRTLEIVFEDEN